MRFDQPLIPGRLVRRYKRFLADVVLDSGETVTCHCPNTGSMMGCADPGLRVWLSRSDSAKRKYPLGWELVRTAEGALVGIHTGRANALVAEALTAGRIPELTGYTERRAEVNLPGGRMRADWVLSGHPEQPDCVVEVKNVTAAVEDGIALFPDAVSERGSRHLQALAGHVAGGGRAAMVYCVQRDDVREVRPADAIDPVYGENLRHSMAAGVEVYALAAAISETGIELTAPVPVVCPPDANGC
ncbi:DNA/RNA nuclease SfsA [Ectothiorhodospiraceae bacterium WFHF3C12]|nr:DNA/RNA nuclease SfsA [Ectothiorhodospiraceae bacterium WFHF3C12]